MRCRILLSNYETAVPSSISDTEIVSFFREQAVGDGFCCWLDHMRGTQDPPEPLVGEDLVVTFFPNNPYNPLRARQRDMSLQEHIDLRMTQMAGFLQTAGDRFHCCIGWETYQPAHWCQPDGSVPVFQTPQEAYAFFRQWLRTSIHHLHWKDARKFQADYPAASKQPAMLELLEQSNEDPNAWNLIVGNNCPGLAHATLEAMPEAQAFWWECLHASTVAMQVGMPFVRGAARQYRKRWLCDIAPYSAPHPDHPEEFYRDMGEWGSLEGSQSGAAKPRINHPRYTDDMTRLGGYSPELALRCWITALLGGCDWLFQEASSVTHLIKTSTGQLKLTPYGQAAKQLADFNHRLADRGTPWTPLTLLMDPYHGINPHHTSSEPWYWMEHTTGSRQAAAFFEAAYPCHGQQQQDRWPWRDLAEYSKMLLEGRDLRSVEQNHLVAGRWPDIFDVLTTYTPDDALLDSRVLFLLGPLSDSRLDTKRLRAWVEQGRTLIVAADTLQTPPEYFPSVETDSESRSGWIDEHGDLHESDEYDYYPLSPAHSVQAADQSSTPDMVHTHERNHTTVQQFHRPDPEEVLFRTDRGEPLVVRRSLGRGSLIFVSAPAGLDKANHLVEPLLRTLDDVCGELFPFEITGPGLQRSCTTTQKGHLLLLINHSECDWHGDVVIKNAAVASVRDLWMQSDLDVHEISPARVAVQPSIPAYGFVVLEVNYHIDA